MSIMGKRIKKLREMKGLTQDELAEILNMNRANISNYERGILTNIPSKPLSKMADFFNVSTDYLLGRTDDPNPNNPIKRFETVAAHRSDDPTDDLPEDARKSLEDFKRYLLKKHGLIKE